MEICFCPIKYQMQLLFSNTAHTVNATDWKITISSYTELVQSNTYSHNFNIIRPPTAWSSY